MALKLTSTDVARLQDKAVRVKARAESALKKADEVVATAVRTAEVGLSAFTFGVLDGRYNGVEVFGMPANLVAGGALHLLGFMGVGGKFSDHLHAFADGAVASYAHTLGRGIGKGWALESKGQKAPAGLIGAALTDEQLAEIAKGRAA